eukprot:CAMPEP_0184506524 /NCGR_PEP_ID=MMETSP0113_2-20130426/53540_1 /TAXON_ID=91329 /ORGANISM="Norrisiella sphaerica, Strain BC52" /LENGTH=242 /DNA_ID=CAMNT_0026896243 /DNA_START=1130 /DNA_END=1855 /DNA_ORIENTATION=+
MLVPLPINTNLYRFGDETSPAAPLSPASSIRQVIVGLMKFLGWEMDNYASICSLTQVPVVVLQTVRYSVHDPVIVRKNVSKRWAQLGLPDAEVLVYKRNKKYQEKHDGQSLLPSETLDDGSDSKLSAGRRSRDAELRIEVYNPEHHLQSAVQTVVASQREKDEICRLSQFPPLMPLLPNDKASSEIMCFDGVIPREASLGASLLDDQDTLSPNTLILGVREWHNQIFPESVVQALAVAVRHW